MQNYLNSTRLQFLFLTFFFLIYWLLRILDVNKFFFTQYQNSTSFDFIFECSNEEEKN